MLMSACVVFDFDKHYKLNTDRHIVDSYQVKARTIYKYQRSNQ
jgi:hypothetical protein